MRARALGAVAVAAIAVAAPAAAAAPSADARAAGRAAAWLSGELAGAPAGQQADGIVALRAAGRGRPALRAPLRRLARVAPAYAVTAGGAAKVALAAVAAGGDPRRLGGVDYLRRITARYASGRYGATSFDQALSMLALRAAGRPVPRDAVRATLAGRGGGGWGLGLSPREADGVDSTGLVIEALRAGGLPSDHPALRAAAAWLLAQRNREGGLAAAGRGGPTNANSTAAAIRALGALGRRAPATTRAALRRLQDPDGGIRFSRASAGSRLIATDDALVALARRHLPVT
jgi:hypothetical protein